MAKAMAELLTNLMLVVPKVFEIIGTTATTVTSTPLLLFTVGIMLTGAGVAMFGRLIRVS